MKRAVGVLLIAATLFFCPILSGARNVASIFGVNLTCNRGEDEARVRAAIVETVKKKSLTVTALDKVYSFFYPEIDYESDLSSLFILAYTFGGSYQPKLTYYIKGAEQIAERIYLDTLSRAEEPRAHFNTESGSFTYSKGKMGLAIDRTRLYNELISWRGDGDITAAAVTLNPEKDLDEVMEATSLRGEFSTYYGYSGEERKGNIALAASSLCLSVKSGEEFSFNGATGERTEKNGYREAKIIFNGKFIDGVGGGVCQVSTTLYNALLLSGLKITEYHPHSLAVGYVEPSFDAMVSYGYSDLKFLNDTGYDVYIYVTADGELLTARVFGKKKTSLIRRASRVIKEYFYEDKEIIESGDYKELNTGEELVLVPARAGIISEGYLIIREENGKERTTKLRSDNYKPIKEVVIRAR